MDWTDGTVLDLQVGWGIEHLTVLTIRNNIVFGLSLNLVFPTKKVPSQNHYIANCWSICQIFHFSDAESRYVSKSNHKNQFHQILVTLPLHTCSLCISKQSSTIDWFRFICGFQIFGFQISIKFSFICKFADEYCCVEIKWEIDNIAISKLEKQQLMTND